MTHRLFVYGTLARGQPNEHILGVIDGTWEEATVTGMLYPKGWGATMGYPAMVLSEAGDEIKGLVFSSNELSEYWAMLDEFEGESYQRVQTSVKLKDDSKVDAYLYVLRDK